MVISHSYVKLPEGILIDDTASSQGCYSGESPVGHFSGQSVQWVIHLRNPNREPDQPLAQAHRLLNHIPVAGRLLLHHQPNYTPVDPKQFFHIHVVILAPDLGNFESISMGNSMNYKQHVFMYYCYLGGSMLV